jgi:hypothetical protein
MNDTHGDVIETHVWSGLPPGTRFVPNPAGSCAWSSHHWIKDRWDQTICAACNGRIEPIPAGPDRAAADALDEALGG